MLGRIVIMAGALSVCPAQARALPIHVALDWHNGMPASAIPRAHIRAVWTAGTANRVMPATVEAEAGPDGVVLDLGEGVWKVEASAPGFWSAGAQIAVAPTSPSSVRLALWPAASLHGDIQMTASEAAPDTLEVRLSAIPAFADETTAPQISFPRTEPAPSRAMLHCPIAKGSWNCAGPAGQFDVRMEAAGYTPRYVWGVRLSAAASIDLGRTELRRTASVFGRAVGKDGANPRGPCRATLQPDTARRGGPDPDEGSETGPDTESAPEPEASVTAPVSQSGYFQVVGIRPGKHALDIECQSASGFRELMVQANGETRIDPAIELEELTLEIAVTPKTDPLGQPWQLTVDATAPRLRPIADKANTSPDGRWARHGLMAGNYRVAVSSSDGTLWPQQFFDLDAASKPLSLRLASVRVAGRVLLGAEPLRARLVFTGEESGEPVTLSSDIAGHFQGLLPVEPGTQGTSWIVEAHATEPPINRRMVGVNVPSVAAGATAQLELAVPLIALRGIVVSQEGRPQRGVQVTLEDSSKTQATTSTDESGSFELPELAPGKYTAVAESADGVSERTPVEVIQGTESELRLVLSPTARVPFFVVSTDGPVADAAVQVWTQPGVPRAYMRTDRDGRFEVSLPQGVAEVGLTIGAPGFALKLIRQRVPSETDQSPDAHTITLDASAGTLDLVLKPPGPPLDNPLTPYLVHNGDIEFAGRLASWGNDQAGAGGEEQVVEAIEPGIYALCFVADPAELANIWAGKLPPDRCHAGKVEPGRTLTLPPQ